MNAEQLLTHFDCIADAPDAIPRLRRFILDLAVRGKLVPQDPDDEPATKLLKRIAAEKDRMVKKGEIKTPKVLLRVCTSEVPFQLPNLWAWALTDNLSPWSLTDGDWIETKDQSENGSLRLIQLADIGEGRFLDRSARFITEETEERLNCTRLEVGDVLIARLPNPIGRACAFPDIGQPAITAVDIAILRLNSDLNRNYVTLALNAPATRRQIEAYGKGTTRFRVSTGHLKTVLVPIPPLAEQHRIVAKVDELMTLCDRLEAARMEREAKRDRMATASLARLNAPDPDPATFQNHAAFAFNNITPLTTRPDQIKTLRQTILNLAVRGKLVAQDPTDETASELLKRIAADRGRLEENRTIKESKPLPPVDAVDAPLDLPVGWAWARFPEVGFFGRGKSKHRPRNDPALYTDGTYPFIQTGDVARSGGSIETYSSLYNDVGLAQSAMWPAGTLCITIAANIADSGILTFDACFPDSIVGFTLHDSLEDVRFFEYFIRTAKADLHEFAPSTAQKNINLGILTEVLIPLPPLAEQHRIVAKVDELMAFCDQLEASLAIGDDTRRHLLDALLHEALEPNGTPKN